MIDKLITEFLIQAIIDNRTVVLVALLVAGKELLEYWLGRTKKVEAGSTLELILLLGKKLASFIKK